MKGYASLALLVYVLPLSIWANQIDKKDKWTLTEHVGSDSTICRAFTEDRNLTRTYALSIQKVKNSSKPVEIFVSEKGKSHYGPMATASINNEILLFNLLKLPQ